MFTFFGLLWSFVWERLCSSHCDDSLVVVLELHVSFGIGYPKPL
jgi:hypothetical protein